MTPEERIERGLKNIDAMMDAREARCVAEDPARKAAGWAPECPIKGFRFYPVRLSDYRQEWSERRRYTFKEDPPCPKT